MRGITLTLVLVTIGCTKPNTTGARCVPGSSAPCACSDGRMGAQLCGPDAAFGACVCSGVGGSGGAGGSGGGNGGNPGTGSGGSGGSAGGPGGGGSGGSGGGSDGGAGPVLLSFGTNVTTLGPGQSVTFTAVLTDPKGIADLIGGQLVSSDGAVKYGAFVADHTGAFTLTLSWDQLNQARPINFSGSGNLDVEAQFFDVAGDDVASTLRLTLACGSAGNAACNGTCATLGPDDCAPCGPTCAPGQTCVNGACSTVANIITVGAPASCDSVCANAGSTCSTACMTSKGAWAQETEYGVKMPYTLVYSLSCSNVPPSSVSDGGGDMLALSVEKCCCAAH